MYHYSTFKFYKKNGQRLAIFGEQVGTFIKVTIIPCSLDETNFSRSKAKLLYNSLEQAEMKVNHTKITIEITDKKGGQSFVKWCRANYYQMQPFILEVPIDLLVKLGEPIAGRRINITTRITVVDSDFTQNEDTNAA